MTIYGSLKLLLSDEVLEEEFRRTETATAPDTDHIALKD